MLASFFSSLSVGAAIPLSAFRPHTHDATCRPWRCTPGPRLYARRHTGVRGLEGGRVSPGAPAAWFRSFCGRTTGPAWEQRRKETRPSLTPSHTLPTPHASSGTPDEPVTRPPGWQGRSTGEAGGIFFLERAAHARTRTRWPPRHTGLSARPSPNTHPLPPSITNKQAAPPPSPARRRLLARADGSGAHHGKVWPGGRAVEGADRQTAGG